MVWHNRNPQENLKNSVSCDCEGNRGHSKRKKGLWVLSSVGGEGEQVKIVSHLWTWVLSNEKWGFQGIRAPVEAKSHGEGCLSHKAGTCACGLQKYRDPPAYCLLLNARVYFPYPTSQESRLSVYVCTYVCCGRETICLCKSQSAQLRITQELLACGLQELNSVWRLSAQLGFVCFVLFLWCRG
jgi:hypothetical protein